MGKETDKETDKQVNTEGETERRDPKTALLRSHMSLSTNRRLFPVQPGPRGSEQDRDGGRAVRAFCSSLSKINTAFIARLLRVGREQWHRATDRGRQGHSGMNWRGLEEVRMRINHWTVAGSPPVKRN